MQVEQDGVIEEQVADAPEQDVPQDQDIVQPDTDEQVQLTEELSPSQGDETPATVEALDENGVPWKNKAMENERKLRETSEFYNNKLEQMVGEAISKAQSNSKPKDQDVPITEQIVKYREFAEENPEHRLWAEARIEELRDKQLEEKLTSVREKERRSLEAERIARESQERVLSNPAFADAFVVDAGGNKQLNYSSTLTQLAQTYMRDPRVSGQPDASEIAFKMAYADMMMSSQGQIAKKVENVKRQNAQLKQSTLVEGQGVKVNRQPVSNYQKAKDELRANPGSRRASQTAVKEYLRQSGIF